MGPSYGIHRKLLQSGRDTATTRMTPGLWVFGVAITVLGKSGFGGWLVVTRSTVRVLCPDWIGQFVRASS